MPESPLTTLERWEDAGATWRVAQLADAHAVVELCTCYGEPVDRLESSDPELIAFLRGGSRDGAPGASSDP